MGHVFFVNSDRVDLQSSKLCLVLTAKQVQGHNDKLNTGWAEE